MAIQTRKNLYRGINPHLNSLLQTPGNEVDGPSLWPGFHVRHITHIADFLSQQLPSSYVAHCERSLQILTDPTQTQYVRISNPEPDVTIFGHPSGSENGDVAVVVAEPVTLVLEDTLDLTEDIAGAVIIRDTRTDEQLGEIVARIELLSPTNKPGRSGYEAYRRKRNDALYSGTPLIELDYLHESAPPLLRVPLYPYQARSHPYRIIISEPRPSVDVGKVRIYGFDVDGAFPIARIPLSNNETISFDFGAVYQHTYLVGRWGDWQSMVDYTQLPARFHTYSPADQERIHQRMAAIAEAHGLGEKLDDEQ